MMSISPGTRNWSGIELTGNSNFVVYTSNMPIVDENTIIQPGLQSGNSNYMRVGKSINGKTLIQFLEIIRVNTIDNHAEEAKIVGESQLDNRDIPNIIKLLSEKLND